MRARGGAERTAEIREQMGGGSYRVPYILGRGPGLPLEVRELHLPIGWKTALDNSGTLSSPEKLAELFELSRKSYDLPPGELHFEDKTGLLKRIDMADGQFLYIDETPGFSLDGKYRFNGVTDLKTGIFLMRMVTRFIDGFGEKAGWPPLVGYLDINYRNRSGFHSGNLILPEGVVDAKKVILPEHGQERAKLRASNVAGRFGLDLREMVFDKRGVLNGVSVTSGFDLASYNLTRDLSGFNYAANDVDNAWQAAALHAIVAEYINGILTRKENGWV